MSPSSRPHRRHAAVLLGLPILALPLAAHAQSPAPGPAASQGAPASITLDALKITDSRIDTVGYQPRRSSLATGSDERRGWTCRNRSMSSPNRS